MKTKVIFTYRSRVLEASAIIYPKFVRVLNGVCAGMLIDNKDVLKIA